MLYNTSVTPEETQGPIDPCGVEKPLVLNSTIGNITSPNYPENYPSLANCQWIIQGDNDTVIILSIIYMHIERR